MASNTDRSIQIAHGLQRARTADILITPDDDNGAQGDDQRPIDFAQLMLSPAILKGLTSAGFFTPSPIQLKAIPIGRVGADMVAQAKSGTGKTCVFSVIVLEAISTATPHTQALILAPTREIAEQSAHVLATIGRYIPGLRHRVLIGGLPIQDDISYLKDKLGCHVAIGTPGRVKALIEKGVLNISTIRLLVMDEADQLFSDSFEVDMEYILQALPRKRQTMAFSATYTDDIRNLIVTYMRNPQFVTLSADAPSLAGVKQYFCEIQPETSKPSSQNRAVSVAQRTRERGQLFARKTQCLLDVLSRIPFHQCVVFSNDKQRAASLVTKLTDSGWPAMATAGDMAQQNRSAVMVALRSFSIRVLVSTDLTARGVDVERITLVINFDLPYDSHTYLHRVGRTGRFGTLGVAISLVSPEEKDTLVGKFASELNTEILPLPDYIPEEYFANPLPEELKDAYEELEEKRKQALEQSETQEKEGKEENKKEKQKQKQKQRQKRKADGQNEKEEEEAEEKEVGQKTKRKRQQQQQQEQEEEEVNEVTRENSIDLTDESSRAKRQKRRGVMGTQSRLNEDEEQEEEQQEEIQSSVGESEEQENDMRVSEEETEQGVEGHEYDAGEDAQQQWGSEEAEEEETQQDVEEGFDGNALDQTLADQEEQDVCVEEDGTGNSSGDIPLSGQSSAPSSSSSHLAPAVSSSRPQSYQQPFQSRNISLRAPFSSSSSSSSSSSPSTSSSASFSSSSSAPYQYPYPYAYPPYSYPYDPYYYSQQAYPQQPYIYNEQAQSSQHSQPNQSSHPSHLPLHSHRPSAYHPDPSLSSFHQQSSFSSTPTPAPMSSPCSCSLAHTHAYWPPTPPYWPACTCAHTHSHCPPSQYPPHPCACSHPYWQLPQQQQCQCHAHAPPPCCHVTPPHMCSSSSSCCASSMPPHTCSCGQCGQSSPQ